MWRSAKQCSWAKPKYHSWQLMPLLEVHLTKGQSDPKADQMSSWPEVIPLVTTRCLYQGCTYDQTKCQADLKLYHSWPLDASTGGTSDQSQPDPKADQMSSWPEVIQLLATICLTGVVCLTKGQPDPKIWQKCQLDPRPPIWGYIWLKCKKDIWKLNTVCILGIASQRSFVWKTN